MSDAWILVPLLFFVLGALPGRMLSRRASLVGAALSLALFGLSAAAFFGLIPSTSWNGNNWETNVSHEFSLGVLVVGLAFSAVFLRLATRRAASVWLRATFWGYGVFVLFIMFIWALTHID